MKPLEYDGDIHCCKYRPAVGDSGAILLLLLHFGDLLVSLYSAYHTLDERSWYTREGE